MENDQLRETVELQKTLVVERQNIFEKQVIYDLKEQNNKLWEKLIGRSDQGERVAEKYNQPENVYDMLLGAKAESRRQPTAILNSMQQQYL